MKAWAVLLLFAVANAKHEQYQGWKSYFVKPSNNVQLKVLGSFVEKYGIDFLSSPAVERNGLALVKPEVHEDFIKSLEDYGIAYKIHAKDVKAQLDIDDEVIETRRRESRGMKNGTIPLDNYLELEEIYDYIDYVAEQYPDLVTILHAGDTFEGRPIKYIKISTTNFEDTNKPIIHIDGGFFGRDWITPSIVLYALQNLTQSDMLDDYDWILAPVINPDGYKYSFTNDRFWIKTRSTDQHLLSGLCPGVNINRNYDFFWNTVGTSNTPCADNYAGSRALSEKESSALNGALVDLISRIVLGISLHDSGSSILFPWSHDGSLSNHAFALQSVGVSIADTIYSNSLPDFPRYIVGNSALVTGIEKSGTGIDYAHMLGIPLTYNLRVPGIEEGTEGFHLDPEYIEQVAKETWAGIVVGARRAAELFGRTRN
ncbi:unnamed protein product [Parnassius apollo]|uniref:(apollo) hypothetical protein n=1 Tax=Parnassius apollo TaxID=110799 RepID=A0A8S3XF86_PARAO|nr:unnamed protein product [Parnassius apollo]